MLSLKSNGEYACDATILASRKRLERAEEQEAEDQDVRPRMLLHIYKETDPKESVKTEWRETTP